MKGCLHLYVVEYRDNGELFRTVLEATSREKCIKRFTREFPHVEFFACY